MERLYKNCDSYDTHSTLSNHYHDEYEMLYIASGNALLTVQGKAYDIQKSSIVFISRYEDHTIIGKGNYKCYFILLSAQTIDEVINDKMLCSVFKNRNVGFSHVYDVSSISDRIESQFLEMVSEYHSNKPYSGNMISLILRQMLIEVLRLYPEVFHPISSQIDEEISRIQEQIDINCTADLKITEVAEKLRFPTKISTRQSTPLTIPSSVCMRPASPMISILPSRRRTSSRPAA